MERGSRVSGSSRKGQVLIRKGGVGGGSLVN